MVADTNIPLALDALRRPNGCECLAPESPSSFAHRPAFTESYCTHASNHRLLVCIGPSTTRFRSLTVARQSVVTASAASATNTSSAYICKYMYNPITIYVCICTDTKPSRTIPRKTQLSNRPFARECRNEQESRYFDFLTFGHWRPSYALSTCLGHANLGSLGCSALRGHNWFAGQSPLPRQMLVELRCVLLLSFRARDGRCFPFRPNRSKNRRSS